jgi:hypothetical protein
MGRVTVDDIGRNGLTRKDLGKYWVIDPVTRVLYVRKTENQAFDLYKLLRA